MAVHILVEKVKQCLCIVVHNPRVSSHFKEMHSHPLILQVAGDEHNFKAHPVTRFVLPFPPSCCFPASFMWLHAAGYLKTSNACKALTISGDCCWVISGKEVSIQYLQPPQRAPLLTHTGTILHTYIKETDLQGSRLAKRKKCDLCAVVCG